MSEISQNYLQSNGFYVTINRLPTTSYWCSGVNLPGINANNPSQSNPFVRLPVPADTADFQQLTIEFNVDSNMQNWTEVMRWMIAFTFPKDFAQFNFGILDNNTLLPGSGSNFYSDISVTVLSNKKNPIAEFVYYNCVPTSLSGLDMSVDSSDANPIRATATFDFSHFDVIKPATTNDLNP